MTNVDVIVPAYNEATSVADVVRVLKYVRGVGRVLVIDDGSKDDTAERAFNAGAEIIRHDPNRGKGQAMLTGVLHTTSDPVMFCDADLVGFRPDHVEALLQLSPHFDMVCGVRDYGRLGNPLQLIGPLITGERVIRRWVLNKLPARCWSGYAIETGINYVCDKNRATIAMAYMRGVQIRGKVKKSGVLKGLLGHVRMFNEIQRTKQALAECGECW